MGTTVVDAELNIDPVPVEVLANVAVEDTGLVWDTEDLV